MITSQQLRQKYISFFVSKNHTAIGTTSLIPENDPTVLFTTAGMHPLVPFLQGQKHPQGTRLTNVQKCIRTGDIDELGDNTHLTFFEMLGNWSLDNYGKREAVERMVGSLCINDDLIRKELGWKPRFTSQQGLQSTVLWHMAQLPSSGTTLPE